MAQFIKINDIVKQKDLYINLNSICEITKKDDSTIIYLTGRYRREYYTDYDYEELLSIKNSYVTGKKFLFDKVILKNGFKYLSNSIVLDIDNIIMFYNYNNKTLLMHYDSFEEDLYLMDYNIDDLNDAIESSIPTPSSISNFTDLNDVPNSYTGSSGKFVSVKDDESGLEFKDVEFSNTFLSLTDTPESYDGQSGKAVFVNGEENGLIFNYAAVIDDYNISTETVFSSDKIDKMISTYTAGEITLKVDRFIGNSEDDLRGLEQALNYISLNRGVGTIILDNPIYFTKNLIVNNIRRLTIKNNMLKFYPAEDNNQDLYSLTINGNVDELYCYVYFDSVDIYGQTGRGSVTRHSDVLKFNVLRNVLTIFFSNCNFVYVGGSIYQNSYHNITIDKMGSSVPKSCSLNLYNCNNYGASALNSSLSIGSKNTAGNPFHTYVNIYNFSYTNENKNNDLIYVSNAEQLNALFNYIFISNDATCRISAEKVNPSGANVSNRLTITPELINLSNNKTSLANDDYLISANTNDVRINKISFENFKNSFSFQNKTFLISDESELVTLPAVAGDFALSDDFLYAKTSSGIWKKVILTIV